MEGSREIAKLLVPTDPWGSWQGLRRQTIFARVSVALTVHSHHTHAPITHTYVNTASSQRPAWINSSFMRAMSVEDGTRRSSDGSQTKVHDISSGRWGLGHERGGLYILHTGCRGGWAFMGDQCRLSVKGAMRGVFESFFFLPICVLRYYMSKCWKEGSEVVINGFSVLGFSKVIQGLTRLSMRLLMLEVKSGW